MTAYLECCLPLQAKHHQMAASSGSSLAAASTAAPAEWPCDQIFGAPQGRQWRKGRALQLCCVVLNLLPGFRPRVSFLEKNKRDHIKIQLSVVHYHSKFTQLRSVQLK